MIELHLHTEYSPLDGLNSPEEYMARASELGMKHLAVTDHGTVIGHRHFQRAASAAGITPILGIEAYFSTTDRFDKRTKAARGDGTSAYNHLVLLAKNAQGLRNLNRLSEIAWTEGFYQKPRIDQEVLREYKDGLIVLSGCMSGPVSRAIEAGDFEKALGIAKSFQNDFGDDYFIEVQAGNPAELNLGLMRVAYSAGIRPVITGDCHYADPKDRWVEEAFLILSTGEKPDRSANFSASQKMNMLDRFNYLYPGRRMTFEKLDLFLADKTTRQVKMEEQGIMDEDIYENTELIASQIEPYPYFEKLDLLPKPKNVDPDERLVALCRQGMKKRGLDSREAWDRLDEELGIIRAKKFPSYFLIKANEINWAKSKGIRVGPGRGSAAGSLVCYVLGITDVNPLDHGLLFWRFIDAEREDWPDIDTDYQDTRRGEVKEYAKRQFKNVASITTVNRLQDKAALKAAARVFAVPFAEANKAIKDINSIEEYNSSESTRDFRRKYPEVLDLARRFEGRISGYGMHAGGLVVSKRPLAEYVPIETRSDKDEKVNGRIQVVALDMTEVENIGMIKLDELGLKALSVIEDTVNFIEVKTGQRIEMPMVFDDPKVFEMISSGYTKGVFQCEQPASTQLIIKMGVSNFNELVVSNALVRPGAANTIGASYIARSRGREPVNYIHEKARPFTEDTYGCVIYQEQVMLMCTELAGMSMQEANKIRRIIGKKKDVSEFEIYRERFIEGASKHISRGRAEKLFHEFEAHAQYSFNKSHAVAYSMLSYWTAFLKTHYPLEFMTAVLKNEPSKESRTDYLIEAKRLGINILLPHVNRSEMSFSIEGNAIRIGLSNVKYLSHKTAQPLLDARPFKNYAELEAAIKTKGSGMNTRMLASLDAIGAAVFPDHPPRGNERDNLYEFVGIPAFAAQELNPRVKSKITSLEDYSENDTAILLAMVRSIKVGPGWKRIDLVDETGSAGVFVRPEAPIEAGQMYAMLVGGKSLLKYVSLEDLVERVPSSLVEFLYSDENDLTDRLVRVVAFVTRTTKAGKRMADMVVTDGIDLEHLLVFPNKYHMAYGRCPEGAIVEIEVTETKDGTRCVESVERYDEQVPE